MISISINDYTLRVEFEKSLSFAQKGYILICLEGASVMKEFLIVSEAFVVALSLLDGLYKSKLIKSRKIFVSGMVLAFLAMSFFQGYIIGSESIANKSIIITDLLLSLEFLAICIINSLLFIKQ